MQKIDFLDSFRGILALSVVFSHTGTNPWLIHGLLFGVIGFFLLSAFLLTFRLIKQYENTSSPQELFKITVNYFVTRTFRIYIPYVCYVAIQTFLSEKFPFIKSQPNWYWLITLQTGSTQATHLWTMPVEIRYYFLIPLIAFAASRIRSDKVLSLISGVIVGLVVFIKPAGFLLIKIEPWNFVNFETMFPIFLMGNFND